MIYSRTWIAISILVWLGTVLFKLGNCSDQAEVRSTKISSSLMDQFEADESIKKNVVLNFKRKPSDVLNMLDTTSQRGGGASTEEEEIELHKTYVETLKLMSEESQDEIIRFLEDKQIESDVSYWISNQLFVMGAGRDVVEALGNFENVEDIEEEEIYNIERPLHEGPVIKEVRSSQVPEWEWNIKKIRAPEALALVGGGKKTICKVGVIDTGVEAGHKAFEKVEFMAWEDPISRNPKPFDDNGHGTHVTGIIVGGGGIGVASGFAKICACKACQRDGKCFQSHITACLQFMTLQKPCVVNNSWGGPGGNTNFDRAIGALVAAHILPVFSAGNKGPSCETVGSPADNKDVISVGSITRSNTLSDFSSRGKSKNGRICPSVSAPGSEIKSAWDTGNDAYRTISGTSMAAPHVTGLLAIIFAKKPDISMDQAMKAVISSCTQSGLQDPHQSCGGTSWPNFPNNMFGNGLIDCVNAVNSVTA